MIQVLLQFIESFWIIDISISMGDLSYWAIPIDRGNRNCSTISSGIVLNADIVGMTLIWVYNYCTNIYLHHIILTKRNLLSVDISQFIQLILLHASIRKNCTKMQTYFIINICFSGRKFTQICNNFEILQNC